MISNTKTPVVRHDDNYKTPAGGAVYVGQNLTFVVKAYKEAKGDFEPYHAGREAARRAPQNGPVFENPEQFILGLVEANRDAHESHAHSVFDYSVAEISLGSEKINIDVIEAAVSNRLRAAAYAAEEQSRPTIRALNDAIGNRTAFEIREEQRPLSPDSYSFHATLFRQLAILVAVLLFDAGYNSLSYAPATPSLLQALATAFSASAAEGFCGALCGTGLRYFNLRSEPGRRNLWRCVTVIAGIAALLIAASLAQYRALLELSASESGNPAAYSIFTVPPSFVGAPVFLGSLVVFGFALFEFRGGPHSRWARHGDHASFDRAAIEAEWTVYDLRDAFATIVQEISADVIHPLAEDNNRDRERLRVGKTIASDAKRKIVDLKNSHLKFVRPAEADIALVRAAIMAERPDITIDDFPSVELRLTDGFPDPAEIDRAVAVAESELVTRTEQLARLEMSVEELASKAQEDFARLLTKAARRDETRPSVNPSPVRKVQIQTAGGAK